MLKTDNVDMAYANFFNTYCITFIAERSSICVRKNPGLPMSYEMHVIKRIIYTEHFYTIKLELWRFSIKHIKIN